MAIYGPKDSTYIVPNPHNPVKRVFYGRRKGWVQRPRTNAPTEFLLQKGGFYRPDLWNEFCDAPNHNVFVNVMNPKIEGLAPGYWGERQRTESLNKCYGKFRDQVYAVSASIANNLAEYRQTVNMIADDANVLREAWNCLRRGQLGKFKKLLRIKARKGDNPWSKPEQAGSLWLQYHFGWDPLVRDIWESVRILEGTFPGLKVTARATSSGSYKLDPIYSGANYDVPEFTYRCMMQADVLVSNQNLHKAAALGLINPVSVAWEIVPFSFVVDWFWPIGQFLNSWTDFVGLSFENCFTTRSAEAKGSSYMRNVQRAPWNGAKYQEQLCMHARYVNRSLVIEGPAFPFPKRFKGFSVVRGATAIALLVGALSNERKYFAQTA